MRCSLYCGQVSHHGYPLDLTPVATAGLTDVRSSAIEAAPPLVPTTSVFKLFDPPRPGRTYAYAPSSITDGPTDYHFYCGNRGNGTLVDQIYLRTYVFDGTSWHLDGDRLVLAPTPGRWDSRHVCDPSVVEGAFVLDAVTYSYAMFYTGTKDSLNNGTHNHIGMALSNDLLTWVKRPGSLIRRAPFETWGVGQPSTTAVSGGEVMLFYTRSDPTATYAVHLDLSDVTNPVTLTPQWAISPEGLLPFANGARFLHNADFAYDPTNDRFWVVHPAGFDAASPAFIATQVELAWMPGADVWAGGGQWTSLGVVNVDVSGCSKNDNAGVQRTSFGTVADPASIRLNVTCSDAGPWPAALWTYRVHSMFVPVGD